jgi:hypothetical protein
LRTFLLHGKVPKADGGEGWNVKNAVNLRANRYKENYFVSQGKNILFYQREEQGMLALIATKG